MYSHKIRTFPGYLLRRGTALTGLSQSTLREYPRSLAYLSFYHSGEIGKVRIYKWGTMETLNDSSGVAQETCGGEREGIRSSKVPLTSSLSPGTRWGGVGQGTVISPACGDGLADTVRSFPSHTG